MSGGAPRSVGFLRILIVSTPVGPLGSGIGGGVEQTVNSLVHGLVAVGHHVEVVAPAGSTSDTVELLQVEMHQIVGVAQASSQLDDRSTPITMPPGSVLAAMWHRIADLSGRFDVVVNLAYDWLPLHLTGSLDVPVVHLISMGSLTDAMDAAIADVAEHHPGRLAAHTLAQASTFADPAWFRVVGSGIVPDRYDLRLRADDPPHLGAIGRISPEKGLEDVAALSAATGLAVKVWGVMQDADYWDRIRADHPGARLEHCGFLPTDELQAAIGGCTAVVMTPKWVEAFGNVAIEAMATGVPVIAYDRGGPAEIVVDGETGFVVPADDLGALVGAVARIATIDRARCRLRVEEHYSTAAFVARVETWLRDVVAAVGVRRV